MDVSHPHFAPDHTDLPFEAGKDQTSITLEIVEAGQAKHHHQDDEYNKSRDPLDPLNSFTPLPHTPSPITPTKSDAGWFARIDENGL
jgi:hypothetical protein